MGEVTASGALTFLPPGGRWVSRLPLPYNGLCDRLCSVLPLLRPTLLALLAPLEAAGRGEGDAAPREGRPRPGKGNPSAQGSSGRLRRQVARRAVTGPQAGARGNASAAQVEASLAGARQPTPGASTPHPSSTHLTLLHMLQRQSPGRAIWPGCRPEPGTRSTGRCW